MAGVIPVIFAAALALYLPRSRPVRRNGQVSSTATSSRRVFVMMLEGGLIIIFTYFYTSVQFNPR
jgi:preprotein translocase subunit SecY